MSLTALRGKMPERFLHVATVLRARRIRDFFPINRLGDPIFKFASQAKGNLGAYVMWWPWRPYEHWTHTIWESEEALEAFIRAEPHRSAIPRLAEWNRGDTAFVRWEAPDARHRWSEVRRRLASPSKQY